MNLNADIEIAVRLLISFGIGTAIGLEREYRSKAAGLRTMIMICLGSTIFTEISLHMAGGGDRIASTIVTGIGFLGAGVIFKDGLTVTGLTTATTIWISAALGMAVGAGEYFIAIVGSGVVLVVLIGFEKLQGLLEKWHQSRTYKITYAYAEDFSSTLEKELDKLRLGYHRKREMKAEGLTILVYEVFGREKRLEKFNDHLLSSRQVSAFEY